MLIQEDIRSNEKQVILLVKSWVYKNMLIWYKSVNLKGIV